MVPNCLPETHHCFQIVLNIASVYYSYCWCNKSTKTVTYTNIYLLTYNSASQKAKTSLIQLKLMCWQGCILLGNFRREPISLLFPAPRGCPHPLAYGPLCSSENPASMAVKSLTSQPPDTDSSASLLHV